MDVTRLQGPDYDRIRSTHPDFLASYANYYLCNDVVICAHFGDSRVDAAAKAAPTRLYPDRAVEQLNIDRLGTGGGGIHCVTQQQPLPGSARKGRHHLGSCRRGRVPAASP
ncbi:agmatine deiminase family protein [Streptomyces anulatus]